MSDLYGDLGIRRNASQKTIKAAYRKLAHKYHPDKNNGDKEAEEKFKTIKFAYEILSDKEKRAEYDQTGNTGKVKSIESMAAGIFMTSYNIALEATAGIAQTDLMKDTAAIIEKGLRQLDQSRKQLKRMKRRVEKTLIKEDKKKNKSATVAQQLLQNQIINMGLTLDKMDLEESIGKIALKVCNWFTSIHDDEEGTNDEAELKAAFQAVTS